MYKIRKMDKEYISEIKDNYRKPEYYREKGTYLFNFMGQDNQEHWKKKLYDMAVEGESEDLKKTTYQILFCNEEKKWWDQVFQMVTAAGKPCYKPSPQVVVTPMDFIKIKIEEKIKDLVAKDKNCAMAEHLNQLDSFSHQNMQYLSERDGSRHNNKTEADEEKPEANLNN